MCTGIALLGALSSIVLPMSASPTRALRQSTGNSTRTNAVTRAVVDGRRPSSNRLIASGKNSDRRMLLLANSLEFLKRSAFMFDRTALAVKNEARQFCLGQPILQLYINDNPVTFG